VDAAPSVAQIERVPEERCARGLLEIARGAPEKYAVCVRRGGGLGEREHEDVLREHALFLDARWRDVDLIAGEAVSLEDA
jgi:hypothetical protein